MQNKNPPIKQWRFLLTFFLFLSVEAFAQNTAEQATFVDSSLLGQRIEWQKLFRSSMSASAKLFEFGPIDQLSVDGRVAVETRQVADQLHLRTDRIQIASTITPGTQILNAVGEWLPIGLSMRVGQEIEVIRYFPTRLESIKALPLSPAQLPWDHRAALALPKNTIVSFPISMAVGVGLGVAHLQYPVLSEAHTGIVWTNEFRLVVMRLAGNEVLVRLMPKRSIAWDSLFTSEIRTTIFSFDANRILRIERNAERLIGSDFARIGFTKYLNSEAGSLDFEMDLSAKDGQVVFDRLLQRSTSIKGVTALATGHVLDMTSMLRLAERDVERVGSIHMVFEGVDQSRGQKFYWHFGMKPLRWGQERALNQHEVETNTNGNPINFKLTHFVDQKQTQSISAKLREYERVDSYAAADQFAGAERGLGIASRRELSSDVDFENFQQILKRFSFVTGQWFQAEPWGRRMTSRLKATYFIYFPPESLQALATMIQNQQIPESYLNQLFDYVMEQRPSRNLFSSAQPMTNWRSSFVSKLMAAFRKGSVSEQYQALIQPFDDRSDFQEFYLAYLRLLHQQAKVPFLADVQMHMNDAEFLNMKNPNQGLYQELNARIVLSQRISGATLLQK